MLVTVARKEAIEIAETAGIARTTEVNKNSEYLGTNLA